MDIERRLDHGKKVRYIRFRIRFTDLLCLVVMVMVLAFQNIVI